MRMVKSCFFVFSLSVVSIFRLIFKAGTASLRHLVDLDELKETSRTNDLAVTCLLPTFGVRLVAGLEPMLRWGAAVA